MGNGAWDETTNHNSPLFSSEVDNDYYYIRNVVWASQYWVSLGAPKEKLMIGMGTYGRGFTLETPDSSDYYSKATGPCREGKYTREAGVLSYYEVCGIIKSGGSVYR